MLVIAALLIFSLVISGCGAAADTAPSGEEVSETAADTSEETVNEPDEAAEEPDESEVAEDEPVEEITITVWHQFSGSEEDPWLESKAAFEAAFPGIRINDTAFAFDDMQAAMTAAFASGEGPDVAFYDASASFLGMLVENDQALDLSDMYAEFGWDDSYFSWAKEKVTYNGAPYGVGGNSEIVGLFYNADLFEEYDLEPPSTWEAMVTAADKALEVGLTPFAQGGLEAWSAGHVCGAITHAMAPIDVIGDAELPSGSGDWTNPLLRDSIAECQKFALDYGYFPADMVAYSTFDALNELTTGEALMRIDGSWDIATFDEGTAETGYTIRMVPVPMNPDPGVPPQAEGGLSSTWIVNAGTEYPDEVGEFLNYFVFSDEVNATWLQLGFLPSVDFDTSSVETTQLTKDALEGIAWTDTGNGLGYWIGWVSDPAYGEYYGAQLQSLLNGQITADEFAANVSEKMAEVRASQ